MKTFASKSNSPAVKKPSSQPFFKKDRAAHLFVSTREKEKPFFNPPGVQAKLASGPSPSPLPQDTPAWSEKGEVYLGPDYFSAEPDQQSEIMRHESVHALHQQTAPVDNSETSRNQAEALANNPQQKPMSALQGGVPEVLGFPVQTHKPWDKVYLGNSGIIGEVIHRGITLRILIRYKGLGIKETTKMEDIGGVRMPMIDKTAPQQYQCAKHPYASLPNIVKKLRQIASKVVELNAKIPAKSVFRTSRVILFPGANDGYRLAFNSGLIVLDSNALNTDVIDTVAHEASHGIFEHHATAGSAKVKSRKPDNFGIAIADLYLKLSQTKGVPIPLKKFSKTSPPPLKSTTVTSKPVGLMIVHDTLWSGKGGHPWSGADEFFASAYGAYTQERRLLKQIIRYYSKFDPKLKPLASALLKLLKKVGQTRKLRNQKAPAKPAAAIRELNNLSMPPDFTPPNGSATTNELLDPSTFQGPRAIRCKP